MMKKIFALLLAVFVLAIVGPEKSEAKVMYDGAEVVKGQTGKMTFKKDIKVYKKNPNGTFDSLVVKRNNFFRTYDIEKYDGKTFYQMGQYRVQATDLVVFKEVPIKIRSSFYQDPTYININRDGIYGKGQYGYGWYFKAGFWSIFFKDTNNGQLLSACDATTDGSYEFCIPFSGTDLKIAETISREKDVLYELTKDTGGKIIPLDGAKSETMHKKGTVLSSLGTEINGYLYVSSEINNVPFTWVPVNLLKPIEDN
ncbi:hypothetical protein [Lysinibacillus odysseyi]|nr:hypothetical protein [Lysinibacillus odysseyi]